jgi:hypothetical protein
MTVSCRQLRGEKPNALIRGVASPLKRTISEQTLFGSDRAGKRFSEVARNVSFAWLPSIKAPCVCTNMSAHGIGTRRFPRECEVMECCGNATSSTLYSVL